MNEYKVIARTKSVCIDIRTLKRCTYELVDRMQWSVVPDETRLSLQTRGVVDCTEYER